ncbi:MAG: pyridoxamine 5'-phosphate oxidase-related FMN-binding protein [Anaerolineaceae bacterium]|nr:MAG: pyridoxamine 5'-phosphate oxidase-related FMN-binding protein [Anaerolineaceae bacterium]
MKSIPESHHDLLKDETKAFVYLATINKDGSPQVTPVWFNADGEYILINSAKGRVKDRNMRSRPNVALCIQDPANPYRYLQIQGKVTEITEQGADEHIDALAFKYLGQDKYPYRKSGEVRVRYKVHIEKVDAHG